MPNNRVCILFIINGLRCGFLTTSDLGVWGRLGPVKSPWGSMKKSDVGAAAGEGERLLTFGRYVRGRGRKSMKDRAGVVPWRYIRPPLSNELPIGKQKCTAN
jgi:hypothetical protein